MIDVNKITSTLAKLGDPELQQYAQMHKNDPYIMALAMSESNRRKEMRAAGQGGQGTQEQPKVVDQMVAEMAPQQMPEDQGIGQLPAGDMNFANGGIIAFADGGDVERYQFGGSLSGDFSGFGGPSPEQQAAAEIRAAEEVRLKQLADLEQKTAFLKSAGAPQAQEAQAQLDALKASMRPKPSPTDPNFRRQTDPRFLGTPAVPSTTPLITSGTTPTSNTKPAAPGGKPPAQAGLGSLDAEAMTKKALEAAAKQPNQFAADITKIGQEKVAAKEAEVTGLKAIQEKFSDVYKGRKERLDKKEGDIETMKDQGLGLALLQAGARIMQTPGSLSQAIGAGVDTGTKQYAAGLDKVRSAQEKLSDARDRLEEIETNRNEMSARELNKAQNEVKTAGIGAREDLLKANMQMYNVNRETALKMVDNQIKVGLSMYEQDQANARTRMQVSAQRDTPDRLVFDQLVKSNQGDAVKAAEALQKLKAEKFNMYEAYSKYLTGFAGKDTLTPPLAFDQFASQFAIPTTKAPGKGATVLTQP
jgi:hypothetical protein